MVPWVWRGGGSALLNDFLVGAGAGLFGLAGLIFLYTGLARGTAAVVAPAAAVVGAAVPVLAGWLGGDTVGVWGTVGVVAALGAIYLVSSTDGVSRSQAGLGYGLGAGAFFGGYFVALAMASDGSGMWPLVASRSVSVVVLLVAAVVVGRSWLRPPEGGAAVAVLGVGVFDLVGNIGYLAATKVGSLVVVAVVASLYPAVTVLLSRFRYHERLSARQIAGLALGVSAVAMLSLP